MGVSETAERVVRFTRSSVLAVRDTDPKPEERDTVLHHVAELVAAADKHRKAGEAEAAVRLLGWAAGLAPGNASLQERMADALDDAGRANEAAEHRKLAATLRAI